MTTSTAVRRVRVDYSYSGHVWHELPGIAAAVSSGIHHRTQSGENDEAFLERVASEIESEFLSQAGEATGADSFAFSAAFAD